jgi:hypothetical protein
MYTYIYRHAGVITLMDGLHYVTSHAGINTLMDVLDYVTFHAGINTLMDVLHSRDGVAALLDALHPFHCQLCMSYSLYTVTKV